MKPLDSLDEIVRKTNTRTKKKKIIIVSEGYKTEIDYFQSLKNKIDSTDRNTLTEIVILQRLYYQNGLSDPLRIVGLTKEYLTYVETGNYSKQLFIGNVIESLIKQYPVKKDDINELSTIINSIINKNNLLNTDGTVKINGALKILSNELYHRFGYQNFELVDIGINYDKTLDEIYIVVDRDKESRPPEKYKKFIEECKTNNFYPIITNPKFELWLLLHHDVDLMKLKNDENYQSLVSRLCKEYGIDKKDLKYDFYIENISKAVSRSKELTTDPDDLEYKIGTNLPSLIKKLKL